MDGAEEPAAPEFANHGLQALHAFLNLRDGVRNLNEHHDDIGALHLDEGRSGGTLTSHPPMMPLTCAERKGR